jgi:hypothetical protein
MEAVLLGEVGDPPHADTKVARVAPEAIWQAPAQNWRRERSVFVSDMAVVVVGGCRCQSGNINATGKSRGFSRSGRIWHGIADHRLVAPGVIS